jgi:hypothetical protein
LSLAGSFSIAAAVAFIESASYLGAGVQTLPSPLRGIAWLKGRDRCRVSAPAIIPTEKQYHYCKRLHNRAKDATLSRQRGLHRTVTTQPARGLVSAVCFVFGLNAAAYGQTLANGLFNLQYSPAGVTSIKRVHDVYDTDYIGSRRSLGDVLIRYRKPGETEWRQAQSAHNPQAAGQQVSYTIGRTIPTLAMLSRASSSVGVRGTSALNDQIEPSNSADWTVPFFVWMNRAGTEEWVQYDFAAPTQVSSAEVYWAEFASGGSRCKLPASWRLQYRDGEQWKAVQPPQHPKATSTGDPDRMYGVAGDRFNAVAFEPVTTTALRLLAQLPTNATSGIFEWRVNTSDTKRIEDVTELGATETFQLQNDALLWTIEIRNQTAEPMEIGDLAIPLPFNTLYVRDRTETYTKRLIRHSFIGGDGSYIFWMRTNSEGPYLVMIPQRGTRLEYFEQSRERSFTVYMHSVASRGELAAKGGTWRLPKSEQKLSPRGMPGDQAHYGFKFRWARDYAAVRDVLYREGAFDVNVVPGMTIPTDLAAMFSLRTRNHIRVIVPEHPDQTTVQDLGPRGRDVHIYQVRFSHLGENMLNVELGDGRYLALEFFVTEPLETVIKKRARFIVTHEQWKDPKLWYTGLYSQWDMKHQVLRSPDDLDGLQSYAVACDDPALGKAPYVAAKNVFFPDKEEIGSVEEYIRHYVWGGLQQTDQEPYPYAIYGIPNWKANRESSYDDRRGKKHLWRIYDYPHVISLYYNMYLIAKNNPHLVHDLDRDGYLQRAFGTAMAFFTVPMEIEKWSADETGTYNELVIPSLIQALEDNGKHDQARALRTHWENKVKYFILGHPYLFGSEYPFDSTGFESTHALAKYAEERLQDPAATEFQRAVKPEDADTFLEQQMKLNLACRGMEPAYYWLGSDYRAGGNGGYTLSYMSQMGGWAVEDYAVNFAKDPTPYLRLGYASYLSSWALLNSGTANTNYGYWYPGKENDGAASGGFEPRPWGQAWLGNKEMGHGPWWYSGEIDLGFSGALRAAATVVADDPVFGLFAYGGELKKKSTSILVIPKDGLRARFNILLHGARVEMELARDGFARDEPFAFNESLDRFTIQIENRAIDQDAHDAILHLRGLPAGAYNVTVAGKTMPRLISRSGEIHDLVVPIRSATTRVTITRSQEGATP